MSTCSFWFLRYLEIQLRTVLPVVAVAVFGICIRSLSLMAAEMTSALSWLAFGINNKPAIISL